eukprot:Seg357.4 transcript_id=Seg357.4/GoldUCD/mRNA.D3Y31 product="hypothetical protein" protein_id=Seg357.4/GoldUCD/D3Y31
MASPLPPTQNQLASPPSPPSINQWQRFPRKQESPKSKFIPGYLSMEPITLDSPQPRSHAHENWRENIQHATPLRAGEEARRAGEVSLNEAEEDRKIAKKLLENVLDGIDWENGSRDYWQDKKHAAIRAHKRLELKNEELEGEMKRAGVTMHNKLRRLEMFEEEALTFHSMIRRLTENCNRGETVYSRRQPQDMASAVKLPKMELKTFDGNVLKWHEFWEGFHHGVHNHPTLPDHQKLQYLKNSLRGAAFVTISDLEMKGEHYQAAVSLLKERFGHKNVLKKAHLDGIERINAVHNNFDVQKLKRLYEELESHYKALLAIGVQPWEYGTTLVPKIMNKLPLDVRIKLTQQKEENEDISMEEVVDGLRKTVKVLEKCGVHSTGGRDSVIDTRRPREKKQQEDGRFPRSTISSGATLVNTETDKREKCTFCLGAHLSLDCKKYPHVRVRKEILQKYKKCYKCLKKGHMVKDCRSARGLCKKCTTRNHHEAICDAGPRQEPKEPTGVIDVKKRVGPVASVAYQTLLAKVKSVDGSKEIKCRILLDSGSARSFMTQHLANELESKPIGGRKAQVFEGLNESTQILETEHHSILVKSLDGNYSSEIDVKTLPSITRVGNPSPLELKEKFDHLKNVFFTDVTSSDQLEIGILLGSQHLADIQTGDIRKGRRGEPVAVGTRLGWTLMGPTQLNEGTAVQEPINLVVENSITVKDEVSRLWDLETLGIRVEDPVHMAFKDEVTFKNGRYSVPLPWREGNFFVPRNKGLAEGRLNSQLRRLKKSPEILKEYDEIIKQQLEEGIIEAVPETPTGNRITYIPHQCVVRQDAATTKVRIVYDASAKTSKGVKSLNECLHTGPSLTPLLFSVLLKFRMHKTVLLADIKQAFLQIEIDQKDRDAMRFLWVKDIAEEESPVVEYRFTRAIFGAGPSPFILGATIHHHLERYQEDEPQLVEDIKASLYVDDYISGEYDANNEGPDALYARKCKLQKMFEDGGFSLRKWFCSNPEICRRINPEASDEPRKVLGVLWCPEEDILRIQLDVQPPNNPVTKRSLLSTLATIYDPLGVTGPVILQARALLQSLCAQGKGWDDELTEAECKQFQAWMKDLQELKYLSFPRLVRQADNKPDETVLHAFCDASSIGYCATVYLVIETAYRIESTLLTAKCRLSPLKKLTIPRLELLAGRTGAKLVQTVIANLTAWKISTVYIWLDSLTALYWIANKGAWKPYVNNRVKEIHQLVPGANWRHCPTQENPADLGTRGASAVKLQHNKLWWEGPQFITEGQESWPSQPKEFQPSEHAMMEERSPSLVVKADEIGSLNVIIDAKRFSRLSKLLVCTARVLRFVNNCRSRVRCVDAMVTPEEMKDAKDRWIKTVQSEMAKREDFQAKTRDLGAYVHSDGYIRCAGRLRNAGLALDQTHPILLPSKHRFTDLVIMESHRNIGHEKVGRTLAEVRSAFWIPRGRQVIKSLLRSCAICKVFASKHIRAPEMAPLPEIRAVRSRPFQHTGVDFAGPLHVKSGQEMVKSYIALFTCATTRAVHLELTPDLTAPIFRMTLEKFAAAWGMPNLLVSDNATTFKTTAIQLKALVEHPEVQEYLQSHFLTWRFNLALASWWGGWFEKMVGLTKTILKKTLGKASLSYFEMEVVLKKTQGILNNRPLFYQGEELEEEVLTPNHLIFGHRLPQMPDVPDDIFEDYKDMTLRLKHVEAKLNELWSRWSREYLVGLREFHKAKVSSKGTAYQLKPGDIILIENKSAHKGMWKKGRILHMVTGKDGVARGASIATIVNGKVHRLERALQQIYPLEIRVEDDIPVKPENLGQSMRRSTRAAAITAKQKISTLVEEVNQQDDD